MNSKTITYLIATVLFIAFGYWAMSRKQSEPFGAPSADSHEADAAEVTNRGTPMDRHISKSGYDITPLSIARVKELASKLEPEAYRVTQRAGTEPAFCGNLLDNKKEGVYVCVVCGLPLFSSANKFHSGTGWPSFYQPFDPEHVARREDRSLGMARTEINCARCNAHLGHVFEDGPAPTHERFCLNSASLRFFEKGEELPPASRPAQASADAASSAPTATTEVSETDAESKTETAYFAGGCFWGIEHYFQEGPGVIDAVSGFMQGGVDHPSYKQVCTDKTGHAETVKVVFDPAKISYHELLEAFFLMIDPTQLNRQGPDYGLQYRSGIWYTSDEQRKEAEAYVHELSKTRFKGRKIVTQVEAAKTFWPAEDYHQDYIEKTGRACHVHNPWPEVAKKEG